MPSLETLRLTWERRVLSILRIMVGMLYMEHGFAKILDFPHQSTQMPAPVFFPDQAKFDAVPAGASGRDFAVGEGAAAGRTVAAARTAGAGRPPWLRYCHVTFSPGRISQWGPHGGAPRGPIAGGLARRRSTTFRDGWTAWRRASRNPAAPRNAVSPWEAGAPRSAASRWEVAANPWLGAIARCSRTGSSNPSPSSGESGANLTFRDEPFARSFEKGRLRRTRTDAIVKPLPAYPPQTFGLGWGNDRNEASSAIAVVEKFIVAQVADCRSIHIGEPARHRVRDRGPAVLPRVHPRGRSSHESPRHGLRPIAARAFPQPSNRSGRWKTPLH
jgi:hypothetical protein